jgi:hypothetical protein
VEVGGPSGAGSGGVVVEVLIAGSCPGSNDVR